MEKLYNDQAAVRETDVSQPDGIPNKIPNKPFEHHGTMVLMCLREPLIGPPLCWETKVSQTADANSSSLVSACKWKDFGKSDISKGWTIPRHVLHL